jgi:uncharacterized protein with PIN domain
LSGKPETRFIADRMVGTLTRYLRFMGYDTESANDIAPGNTKEDTLLLGRAHREGRILLTRDAELARRGGEIAVLVRGEDVMDQIQQLTGLGFVELQLRLSRCSLCNTELRDASDEETGSADYAPRDKAGFSFYWCPHCRKLYWNGSHGKRLEERIGKNRAESGVTNDPV